MPQRKQLVGGDYVGGRWSLSEDGRINHMALFVDRGDGPSLAGSLDVEGSSRRRISTFRYDQHWVTAGVDITPTGLARRRNAYPSAPYEVPLAFYDAMPDGWGKAILERTFPDQVFGAAEFLAATSDDRTGDLRFGPSPAGPERWIPAVDIAMAVTTGEESFEDLIEAAHAADDHRATPTQLRALFRSSADIGGARPKARVRIGGRQWIAKLRAEGDAFDDPRVEAACLTLARHCGIEVPAHHVKKIGKRTVLLVERFDRVEGRRLGYASAATILGHPQDRYATGLSYAELAATARRARITPCEPELFARMLFNGFIHNTDDHLRNHGFLREPSGWRLSPAFDLVPSRERSLVLTPAPGMPHTADPAVAFAAYPHFQLDRSTAVRIYNKIARGMARLDECLDEHAVTKADREILRDRWKKARAPVPASKLPA